MRIELDKFMNMASNCSYSPALSIAIEQRAARMPSKEVELQRVAIVE